MKFSKLSNNLFCSIFLSNPLVNLFNVLHIIAFCHTQSNNLLLLKLKKLTSGLLKNLEQNKLLLNLENFTSHCLKNPEIWLVLLIGPLLIRTYCVYCSESNRWNVLIWRKKQLPPKNRRENSTVAIFVSFLWFSKVETEFSPFGVVRVHQIA